MASNSIKRDHHLWTRDTIKNISGDVTLDMAGDIILDADGDNIKMLAGGTGSGLDFIQSGTGDYTIKNLTSDKDTIFNVNDGGSDTEVMRLDGSASSLLIASTNKIEFNSANNYIQAEGANDVKCLANRHLTLEAGGILYLKSDTNITFEQGTGFTQISETFSDDSIIGSGGTDDTHIDFRAGNKVYLLMTADVVNMNLIFPAVSGNFLLQLRYDGDHDITNWKVYESDASTSDGDTNVKWARGSAPATTDSGYDIFTFYWDATNQVAFGVGSLGFAS